ncbi:hypothetical protein FACS1894123_06140 [Bacteroidia bacterium]|nr:hypothetical protein FACS1894123_06140 [Bacteroidia bacterium]
MSSLDAYSQGIRSGSEINRLEREAMKDTLLSDSLDGYDTIKGNHAERILEIRKEIAVQTGSRSQELRRWIAMAGILLLLVAGGFFFITHLLSSGKSVKIVTKTEHFSIEKTSPDINIQPSEIQDEEIQIETEYVMPDALTEELPETKTSNSVLPENLELEPIQTPELNDIKLPGISENFTIMQETDNLPSLDNFDYASLENQIPQPVIGISAYRKYIRTEMIKPTDKKCRKANGKVVLTFYIDGNGHPTNILVKKSLCSAADEEALRLLINGPDWTIGNKQVELEIKF